VYQEVEDTFDCLLKTIQELLDHMITLDIYGELLPDKLRVGILKRFYKDTIGFCADAMSLYKMRKSRLYKLSCKVARFTNQ